MNRFRPRRLALVLALAISCAHPAAAMVAAPDAPGLERHMVMVLSAKGGFCSGAVLAPDVVLTAAHCVTGSNDYRVHFRDEGGNPVLIPPRAVAVHPGYDKGAVAGRRRSVDLGMIRLSTPLPARFVPLSLGDGLASLGQRWTVAGYGLAQENAPVTGGKARAADLAVIEPYGRSTILVWLADPATGGKTQGAGACTGDSGGPILDPEGRLGAITTWSEGVGKARCGTLTQGVLVGPQRSWIESVRAGWR